MEFHENPSNGSRFVPRGQKVERTDRHMAKLIVIFRNFANGPTNK